MNADLIREIIREELQTALAAFFNAAPVAHNTHRPDAPLSEVPATAKEMAWASRLVAQNLAARAVKNVNKQRRAA